MVDQSIDGSGMACLSSCSMVSRVTEILTGRRTHHRQLRLPPGRAPDGPWPLGNRPREFASGETLGLDMEW